MKTRTLNLGFAAIVVLMLSSSFGDSRLLAGTANGDDERKESSIRIEGQIKEIIPGNDGVTIHIHHGQYAIEAGSFTRVRWLDGRRTRARDLRTGDNIRVEGNVVDNVLVANRVTILPRAETYGGF